LLIREYQKENEQNIKYQKELQEETESANKALIMVIEEKHKLERNKIYEVIRHKI
jgi:hypothetical protein